MKKLTNGLLGVALLACSASAAKANEGVTDAPNLEINTVESEITSEPTLLTSEKSDRDKKQAGRRDRKGPQRAGRDQLGPGGPAAMRRGKPGPPFGNLSKEQIEKIRERMQMHRERGHEGGPPWAHRDQRQRQRPNMARRSGGKERWSRTAHRGQRASSDRLARRPERDADHRSRRRRGPEHSERGMNRSQRGSQRGSGRGQARRGPAAVQELRREMNELQRAVRRLSEQLEQQSA